MKNLTTLFAVLALAACGGSKPAPAPVEPPPVEATPPPVANVDPAPVQAPPPAVEPPPPPPPAKVMKAKAELTPVKGQKFKPTTVVFSQKEGDPTSEITSSGVEGLKAGSYHLVVHTATGCGPNATKAGPAFAGAATPVDFKADASSNSIDVPTAPVQVEGDQGVTGHVLVLHDDKGGKVGKAIACGPITSAAE